jgi:hypothetical protein
MGMSLGARRAVDRVGLAVLAMLLTLHAGCGYRRPSLMAVEAAMTLAGEPVGGAEVMLVPLGPGRPVRGISDESGRITFSTYGSADGVPKGSYKAVVSKLEMTTKAARKLEALQAKRPSSGEDDAPQPMLETVDADFRNLLPARYASVETTPLTVVIDGTTRRVTLELEPEASSK